MLPPMALMPQDDQPSLMPSPATLPDRRVAPTPPWRKTAVELPIVQQPPTTLVLEQTVVLQAPATPPLPATLPCSDTGGAMWPPPPPPPPGPPRSSRTVGSHTRRRTTGELCDSPGCAFFREGLGCQKCAVHCEASDCTVHRFHPRFCLFQGGNKCKNQYAPDCVIMECAAHCRAPNCSRHRSEAPPKPQPPRGRNRVRGLRSNAKYWARKGGALGPTPR